MANALDQLKGFLEGLSEVGSIEKCWFRFESYALDDYVHSREGWSEAVEKFLDRDYDDGYGGQELFGVIWLTDGTWIERNEYDGSEWWRHVTCPEFPGFKPKNAGA